MIYSFLLVDPSIILPKNRLDKKAILFAAGRGRG